MKKIRKKKRAANLNRALDEHDDVDDSDLVAGPAKRQRIASDGDAQSSEEEEDDEVEAEEPGLLSSKGQDGELDKLEKRNTRRKKQA
jgi:hypothetical protein